MKRFNISWVDEEEEHPEGVYVAYADVADLQRQLAARDEVVDAARKLVAGKGRYHTEQNYKALAAALEKLK